MTDSWMDDPGSPEWDSRVIMRVPFPTARVIAQTLGAVVLVIAGWLRFERRN
jgi:hypothetical protein